MKPGSAIINTTSINPYTGNPQLIDYTATKGAINGFTRSMAQALVNDGIRVNAVAPYRSGHRLSRRHSQKKRSLPSVRIRRWAYQPVEHVGCYVLSDESSYMTGQTLHVNGGGFVTT